MSDFKCPRCQSTNFKEDMDACPDCGIKADDDIIKCFRCDMEVDEDATKCPHCGLDADEVKSRIPAALLAIIGGGVGMHKFYHGSWGWGIIYFFLCTTGISFTAGIIEGIGLLLLGDTFYFRRYCDKPSHPFKF